MRSTASCPRQLAYVSEGTHAPLVAIWMVGAGSIVFLFLYVYTHIFATLTGIFGFILGFCLVSIAGILFPYRLPEVFESSPVRWRVGGRPGDDASSARSRSPPASRRS